MKVTSEKEIAQLCPTVSDPMDCSLPGSSIHGIFQARVLEWGATDPLLGHKTNLKKCKRIEIISNIFSGHNGMKLGINHRKRNEKKKPIT